MLIISAALFVLAGIIASAESASATYAALWLLALSAIFLAERDKR